ncbi:cell wall protein [Microbacterium sp. 18062]|uniref:cell wall protein n=1 Tax=Microbacterium sp. 18062 TaxID=2681410 RepID=UPI0013582C8B|nr:cell wall protein [Microbacterium sp. 18062]
MWGKILRAAGIAALLVIATPTAAHAGIDRYTPVTPREPTLAGSVVEPVCHDGTPWIAYSLTLTGGDDLAGAATLVLSDGKNAVELPLGALSDGRLDGEILWPGASSDTGALPGWELADERWVETDGNYRWTRGAITAVVHAGAELEVPLAYPSPASGCAADPAGLAAALPATGNAVPVLPIALGGVAAMLVGAGVFAIARRVRRADPVAR